MKFLITGGSGFIGSALVRHLMSLQVHQILNIDKQTYASHPQSLEEYDKNVNYSFKKVDICDLKKLTEAFNEFKPEVVINLAAESHVDRSINGPGEFIKTNIMGTYNLLEVSLDYYRKLKKPNEKFVFLHISTDEVYGDLYDLGGAANEESIYRPSSPYSASKASSDHIVNAWHKTYGLPALVTNCSNNYGPYQHPEKLIPLVINKALSHLEIPMYGKGDQIRDWLFVEDHAKAIIEVALKGKVGESYNIGTFNEKTNREVIEDILSILQTIRPIDSSIYKTYTDLIRSVSDRPGHDRRYAIDSSKITNELNWHPEESYESGLIKTVNWYIDHQDWSNFFLERK